MEATTMNRQKAWIWPVFAVLIAFSMLLPARSWADDYDDDNRNYDPPSRVARMNYVQGSVSFQPGGEGDWVEAVPNRPLTSGDNLWTDRGARSELHVGSTAIRLGSETSVTFLDLNDQTLQLRVAQGTVIVRMLHMDDDDLVEIDTPNLAFQVTRAGEFRVDVRPDGRTTVLDVVHGRGDVIGGGSTYSVVAGQEAVFTGEDQLSYDIDSLPAPDSFDRWSSERNRREDQSRASNYVSREMTGYEDLDDNGRWSYAGDYGNVWIPSGIPVGWAPYRYGHWVYIAPWGWTWVDDQPWGFAPFHYGRWCQVGGFWAWVPGPVVVRPVYAPALVAFVGGGGFSLSVSFGGGPGIGWFPLAPGEVFMPSYHVSRTYVNQVNVTNTVVNVTKVTNVYNYYVHNNTTVINRVNYVNQNAPHAITAVSRETFINARPVARNVVTVAPRDIAQAPVVRMPVADPIRTSVIGAGRPTKIAPPIAVVNRQVVAERIPAPPPTPFSQRQDKLIVRPVTPVTQQGNWRPQPQGNTQEPVTNRPRPYTPQQPPVNRPAPPVNRPDTPMNRPEPPAVRNMPAPAQPAPRPEGQAPQRPAEPPTYQPRPENAQPPHAQPGQPAPPRPVTTEPAHPEPVRQPPHPPEPPSATREDQGWSHPLARPAPPVQPKSEQQTQQDETKYRNWQRKEQERPAPRPETQRPDNRTNKDNKDKKPN
jgi:hypothetical protein